MYCNYCHQEQPKNHVSECSGCKTHSLHQVQVGIYQCSQCGVITRADPKPEKLDKSKKVEVIAPEQIEEKLPE